MNDEITSTQLSESCLCFVIGYCYQNLFIYYTKS